SSRTRRSRDGTGTCSGASEAALAGGPQLAAVPPRYRRAPMRSLARSGQPVDRIRSAPAARETARLGALIALLAVASRLPFLLSRSLPLDGDEAILGLAAAQLLEGRSLPVFFPGQRYGF